jgi:beta-glucosidase
LNKNGRLDVYEDPARPVAERVADLLAQMTLEEKAGLMFHTILAVGQDGELVEGMTPFGPMSTRAMVLEKNMSAFNVHEMPAPRLAVRWYNHLQELAEKTRLGVPVTISSVPRHGFSDNPLTSLASGNFSQWPEPIGLAALGDPQVVEQFADIARQEYLAVGIRLALHPMADLATEPRWARINGTFGEDAGLAARLLRAYIRGFQGSELGAQSVACMTKHFPGGGPQKDGEDPHFAYGREQVYPGGNFDYHLRPFEAAFEAGTAQVMPYYGMPVDTPYEEVGFGFNRGVIHGLLREKYGFDGVVCTDWGLLTDTGVGDQVMNARAWGVEHLSGPERALMAGEAGVDQFGGEACPEVVVELVRAGLVSEARIDQSVRRILRDKFRLGLFDDPYLSEEAAAQVVGCEAFRLAGELAQRRSMVLLKNGFSPDRPLLPLQGRPRLYLHNVSAEVAAGYGDVVPSPEEADLAILRLKAPYEPRDHEFLEFMFHAGDLDFKPPELGKLLDLLRRVPTVVDIYLDRPAVIPEINASAAGLLGDFGASDAALLDVLFGRVSPAGRLPFELPSSMEAVRKQKADLPYDSAGPLYPFGYGLSY